MGFLRLPLLTVLLGCSLGARIRSKSKEPEGIFDWGTVLPPDTKDLRNVAVVLNPGGFVKPELYFESMRLWQAEAMRSGISLWVSVLGYWFDLPLPDRTKANVNNAIKSMTADFGMSADAPVYFSGHSMGGGAALPVIQSLYEDGTISGVILKAAYVTRSFLPPVAEELTFTIPTLTMGAELNYGSSRPTRLAESMYHLPESTHPVVVIEGMNHGQFFTGGSFKDLKPEISREEAQLQVAEIAIDWLAKQEGIGKGSLLASEVARTRAFFAPLIAAFELEGARNFNVPNQVGTPNWDCPLGVCPQGSRWVEEAQAYIAGNEVMKSGAKAMNNFADLFPFESGEREERKPFIEGDVLQSYVFASRNDGDMGDREGKDFAKDESPFATGELLTKMVSRQSAGKSLLGRSLERDQDVCVDLNAQAYKYALENAGEKTRKRFEAHGQKLTFDPTKYEGAGPLWLLQPMRWKEKSGQMNLRSVGLFTPIGDRAIDGNHYCKLLSPAKAMEWVYLDGLKKNLFGDWQ